MENMNVKQLKAEAKRLGLIKHSRLRKQELIELISDIIDQPVPADFNGPVLRLTRNFQQQPKNAS